MGKYHNINTMEFYPMSFWGTDLTQCLIDMEVQKARPLFQGVTNSYIICASEFPHKIKLRLVSSWDHILA